MLHKHTTLMRSQHWFRLQHQANAWASLQRDSYPRITSLGHKQIICFTIVVWNAQPRRCSQGPILSLQINPDLGLFSMDVISQSCPKFNCTLNKYFNGFICGYYISVPLGVCLGTSCQKKRHQVLDEVFGWCHQGAKTSFMTQREI